MRCNELRSFLHDTTQAAVLVLLAVLDSCMWCTACVGCVACALVLHQHGWQVLQELLQVCGRAHTLQDVHRAVDAMHQAGPPSWSLDLIGGLPDLTLAKWQHSLQSAVAASPPHISVYDLQVLLLHNQHALFGHTCPACK